MKAGEGARGADGDIARGGAGCCPRGVPGREAGWAPTILAAAEE